MNMSHWRISDEDEPPPSITEAEHEREVAQLEEDMSEMRIKLSVLDSQSVSSV